MVGATNSDKGVFTDSPTPILPNIVREPTRESLIKIHRLIGGNADSVASNLGGGQHGHLVLTMTVEDYLYQTGHVFVPQQNPVDYPPMMGTAQEQALGIEKFSKKQALFQRCTTIDGSIKNKIYTAVQQVFLSSIMYKLEGFVQLVSLDMLQHIFWSSGEIDESELEGNYVKMMRPYDPLEPLPCLFNQL